MTDSPLTAAELDGLERWALGLPPERRAEAEQALRLVAGYRRAMEELDYWLSAYELPGDHSELEQCAIRTRLLLEAHNGRK